MRNSIRHTLDSLCSLSVGKKIFFATTFSSILTLSVFSVLYIIHEKNSFLQKKAEHLESSSAIIAVNSEAALSFDDSQTAGDYLSSLEFDPDITLAILFNTEGEPFASFQRNKSSSLPSLPDWQGSSIGDNSVRYVEEITMYEEHLGTLLIEADTSTLHQTIKTAVFKALTFIGLGTLFSVIVAVFMQRLITRPLFELEEFAKNVTKDGDYTQRTPKRYHDEVGSLVDSINTMISCVQQREEDIKDHNKTLEKKVSIRTHELRKAMEQARAASDAKSEFLSTISHELRTPLNAIVGLSEVISRENLTPELASNVRIIQSSSDSLLALINQILDYSKIENGKMDLEAREYNLVDCIQDSMDMASSVHWEKPVDFFTTIDPELPNMITGDITRVRQVLVNLIGNSSKFTKRGYIWLEAKLQKGTEEIRTPHLQISIHDTGIGIPADRIGKLFKAFSQVDSSTTREFGGTGLGLAITKKLVTAMGGDIQVTSEYTKGTTFSFTLPCIMPSTETVAEFLCPPNIKAGTTLSLAVPFEPLHNTISSTLEKWGITVAPNEATTDLSIASRFYSFPAGNSSNDPKSTLTLLHPQKQNLVEDGARSIGQLNLKELRNFISQSKVTPNVTYTPPPVKKVEASLPKGVRILLAEDNKVNQKVFQILMKKEGYQVDISNNGQEAVAAMHKAPYQLVFMDLQMPIMDGLDATKKIRSESEIAQPWIIGFTANVQRDAEPAMRAAGMNDFITKPVNIDRLREVLRRFATETNLKQIS